MKGLLCVLVLGAALAHGQTAPAARDLGVVAQEVLGSIQNVKNHTGALLKELQKPQPDRQAVQATLTEALGQVKQIRKLIEELDAFYGSMPEAQQSALRRSWSVAMILNGCLESALESLADPSADVWSEVRTGVECAQRRGDQLEEVLSPFRRAR
ncbi:MAG: hypothetical protein N2036_07700 [Bryobacteraceae bacterium]|nr:hypothetical protein [Bryobacteraceae bacterium]MCX7603944.1 hypothetical protein [Bryobacteraceae bacterium]